MKEGVGDKGSRGGGKGRSGVNKVGGGVKGDQGSLK